MQITTKRACCHQCFFVFFAVMMCVGFLFPEMVEAKEPFTGHASSIDGLTISISQPVSFSEGSVAASYASFDGFHRGAGYDANFSANYSTFFFNKKESEINLLMEPDHHAPSRWGALLRSFAVPGWGHRYVNRDEWRWGQYHLGAEVILVTSALIINRRANVLETNMFTYAGSHSGTDIRGRDREFQLAVGNFNSLAEYNDYQERTRNLDRRFPVTAEYQWQWESEQHRLDYRNMRSDRDHLNQQIPAIVAVMVVNRVVSGISAFSRAGSLSASGIDAYLIPDPDYGRVLFGFSCSF